MISTGINIWPNDVYAAPINGDNHLDVVAASDEQGWIILYENNGDGTFGGEQFLTDADPSSVHTADLDGDGDHDIVSNLRYLGKIVWYENYGNGSFSGSQVISTSVSYPEETLGADLDGDGDPDVLSASWQDNKVAWYENLRVPTPNQPPTVPVHYHHPTTPPVLTPRASCSNGTPAPTPKATPLNTA